MSDDVLLLLMC